MEANQVANNQNILKNSVYYKKANENQQQPRETLDDNSCLNKNISDNKFQQINKVTNPKKLLKSFKKIARCLNNVDPANFSNEKYDKVCLILISKSQRQKPISQVGELNDAYMFGLYHNRLGFKVFYLYNSTQKNYFASLQYFLSNVKENLTIFCSCNNMVDFKNLKFSNKYEENNQADKKKCKIVFISDCNEGNTIFDIPNENDDLINTQEVLSFTISKIMHGIFIYYYCKTIFNDPSITLKKFFVKMKNSLTRFKETFAYKTSNQVNQNEPIYTNCICQACQFFNDPVDDNDDDSYEVNDEEESFYDNSEM